ncbi:MAG: hypothetical protein RSA86_06475 [Christensenellaceae bacterium]
MKKLLPVLLTLMIILGGMQTVFAAEPPTPTAIPTPPSVQQNALAIDNLNTYSGMDKPYNNGYIPLVQNGAARLVLPLTSSQPLNGNTVKVTVNLGEPSTSPFVFGNYDTSVTLQSNTVSGGGTVDSYLIDLNLPLTQRRKMGRYPVVLNVSAQAQDTTSVTQSFTLFVTITDGIDPDATPSPTPAQPTPTPVPSEAPIPQAKVIISNYSITPSPAMAGEEFVLSVTFQNTSESQSLSNVKITAKGETTDVIPSGDSSFYFKKIGKNESFDVDVKMMVRQDVKPVPQKVLFKIEYENAKATAFSADEEIVVQLKQPIRIAYDPPKIPKEVNAGDTISVSVNVLNMGKGILYNVRMMLEAQGIIPDSSAFIGNMESGTSKKGDIYAFIGTMNMTEGNSDEKYGQTSGNITISYEDEYGQEYKEEIPFSTTINPPVIAPAQEVEEEKPQTQSQWWISVIIAGGIIAAIVLVLKYLKKKKQREYENEDT